MPTNTSQSVTSLSLDLKNFRTVPQKKEQSAIKAMITIKPDRFFAIIESLIEDGYIPTENIIVLKDGSTLTVKEGNRRIAALKLLHGQYKISEFGIPNSIIEKAKKLDAQWKKENLTVPCTIFPKSESAKADKVVALAHGKGEKASRDPWSSVATARHNRDAKQTAEPALDLLEKYLKFGNNLNNQQKERWAGDYNLTVLHEAIRVLLPRLGYSSFNDLVTKYPKVKLSSQLEDLMLDIGLEIVQFKTIRDTQKDFAIVYGLPAALASSPSNSGTTNSTTGSPTSSTTTTSSSGTPQSKGAVAAPKAYATNDPKYVSATLKKFTPKGNNRQKVVLLKDEIRKIKIKDTPIAFCFILRSLFEISAKAYCSDHSISLTKIGKQGKPPQDKTLAELLTDITNHITSNNTNKPLVKVLHGAHTEIKKPSGILSVTSMNNLVHNPSFSIQPNDICTLFGNIYPLLEAMN